MHITAIYLTHGHSDHSTCIGDIQEFIGSVPVHLHEADWFMIKNIINTMKEKNASLTVQHMKNGEKFTVGEYQGRCIYTPGHSTGSFCFQIHKIMFSGDTLFRRGRGRTDLKGGSESKMQESLKKLYAMDPFIFVFPGHGEETSILSERPRY